MPKTSTDPLLIELQQALSDCRELYSSAAQTCVDQHCLPQEKSSSEFAQLMNDLHKGVVVKTLMTVAAADERWYRSEQMLAGVLFKHLWNRQLAPEEMEHAIRGISERAVHLSWYSLIRFFDVINPLRNRFSELNAIVIRLANLFAKADGSVSSIEKSRLEAIQKEFDHLQRIPLDEASEYDASSAFLTQAVSDTDSETRDLRKQMDQEDRSTTPTVRKVSAEEILAQAKEELEQLIGLKRIKDEILTLSNFLQMQQHRADAGLPEMNLSLHMVFAGNPGTGKTTVARIVGKLLAGLGVLKSGQLIETDRSGLVAEYAGQTGPKTHKKIDEAMDGVLFVDEAYSLIAEEGEDAFGREAVAALLKRMEDDRERLVVIVAGYPEPMDRLLKSNPGLSSRINSKFVFDDYDVADLGKIFQVMCQANHFEVATEARAKLLLGFKWLYDHRDQHFGNGRMVRNSFENALRRLANRIAGIAPITHELLTVLHSQDVEFSKVPDSIFDNLKEQQFTVTCPGCENASRVPTRFLGNRVRCNRCQHRFTAEWGNPCETS